MPLKKKKFTIPKRAPCRELLQHCESGSREYAEITSEIERSLWNSKCGLSVRRIETVNNESLSSQFNKKKLELQKETSKRQEVSYAFKLVDDYEQAKNICKSGFSTNLNDPINLTCLGDPQFGVYLSRCADVLTRSPPRPDAELIMIIAQVVKGRFKSIAEQHGIGDFMEPTPFHDCHLSKDFRQYDASSMRNSYTFSKLFDSCLMYLYEIDTDLEDLYVKRPRNCNPYAVVFFRFEFQRHASFGEIPFYKAQPKNPIASSEEMLWSTSKRDHPDHSDDLRSSNNFASKLESAVTVWSGKLCNKATSLTDVYIKCHAREFTRDFPILGDYLSFHTKTDISRLKDFLPENLFSKPPLSSEDPLAYSKGEEYLHCEMYPKNQRSTSFARLTRSLKVNSQALFLKLPFENSLFMLPTSDLTDMLGITFNGYPEVLHLLFIRKIPEDAGILHKSKAFLLDARSILKSKVLEIEKLKLTTPFGVPNPLQDVDIDSESPFHDNTEWHVYPRYFKEIEKESIRARVQRVRQAVIKEKIMSGHKKYKYTYKTPYFVTEPGSNSGPQRVKKGKSKAVRTSSLKAGEKSASESLSTEALGKEQSKLRDVDEGATRKSLDGAGLTSYNFTRDPRLSRKRSCDDLQNDSALTNASVSHKTQENSPEVVDGTTLFVDNSERVSSIPALSCSNGSQKYDNNNTTSNMDNYHSPIWATEDAPATRGHPSTLAIKHSNNNESKDHNEYKNLPSNSKQASFESAPLKTSRLLTDTVIRHEVSAQYDGRYRNDCVISNRDMSNGSLSFSTKRSLNPLLTSKKDNALELSDTKLCRVEDSRNETLLSEDKLPPPPLPPVLANLLSPKSYREFSTTVCFPDKQTLPKAGDEESKSSFRTAAACPPLLEKKSSAITTAGCPPVESKSSVNITSTCISSAPQNTQSTATVRTKDTVKRHILDMPNSGELNSPFTYSPSCSNGDDQPLGKKAAAISKGDKARTSQSELIHCKTDLNTAFNDSDNSSNSGKKAVHSGGVTSENINITRGSEVCGRQDETNKSIITSSNKQDSLVPHLADANIHEHLTENTSLASTQNRQLADNSVPSSNSKVVLTNHTMKKESAQALPATNLEDITSKEKLYNIPVVSANRGFFIMPEAEVQQMQQMQQINAADLAIVYAQQMVHQKAMFQRNLQFAQRPQGHWRRAISQYPQQPVFQMRLPFIAAQSNAPLPPIPLSPTLRHPMLRFQQSMPRFFRRNDYFPRQPFLTPRFIANNGGTLRPNAKSTLIHEKSDSFSKPPAAANGTDNEKTQNERNAEENVGKFNAEPEASGAKDENNSDGITEGKAMGASEENGNNEMGVEECRGNESNHTEQGPWNLKVNLDSQLTADEGDISNLIDISTTKDAYVTTIPPETQTLHRSCNPCDAVEEMPKGVEVLGETLHNNDVDPCMPINLSPRELIARKGESEVENKEPNYSDDRKEDSYLSQQKSLEDLSRTRDELEESETLPGRLEKQNRNYEDKMYQYNNSDMNLDKDTVSSEEVSKFIANFKKVLGSLDKEINESRSLRLARESKIEGSDSGNDKNRQEHPYIFQGNQTTEEYKRLDSGWSEMKRKGMLNGDKNDHDAIKEKVFKITVGNRNNELPLEVDLKAIKEQNATKWTYSNAESTRTNSCNPMGLTASMNVYGLKDIRSSRTVFEDETNGKRDYGLDENRSRVINSYPVLKSNPVEHELKSKCYDHSSRKEFKVYSELSAEMQVERNKYFNFEDLSSVEHDSKKYGIDVEPRQPVHDGVNVDSKKIKSKLQTTEIASENTAESQKHGRRIRENEFTTYTNMALWEVLDEYLNAKQISSENETLVRQEPAIDVAVRQKNTGRSRRVKLMSNKILMTSPQDSGGSNRVTVVKKENQDEKMPASGEERSEEEVALDAEIQQTDLRAILNKKRGRRSLVRNPIASQNDVFFSDDAQNSREIDYKVVVRKVSVMEQKIEKPYVSDVQKKISSYNTSSLQKVKTSKWRYSEPESSDNHRKLAKHSEQRKRRYSRSDRSRKRRRSDERREYSSRKRSYSSSSSTSEGSYRRGKPTRTRVRKRRYHSRDKDPLEGKPDSHQAKTNKYDDMINHSYVNKVLPISKADERADEVVNNTSKEIDNRCIEQTSSRDRDGSHREKRETDGSSLNWYNVDAFNKFGVRNDGVDDVNATTCEKIVDDDNGDGGFANDDNGGVNEDDNGGDIEDDNGGDNEDDNDDDNGDDNEDDDNEDDENEDDENEDDDDVGDDPEKLASVDGLNQPALMTQCESDFMVNDELYSNISPVSDADDTVDPEGQDERDHSYKGSDDKLGDLVDVPKADMNNINKRVTNDLEEYRQLDNTDVEETEAAGNEPAHVEMEEADKCSIADKTAVPLHDTSNIMQKLMSDSQSTAKVLLKNHVSPKFKERPLLPNQDRDSSEQLSTLGDPEHNSSEFNAKEHAGRGQSEEDINVKDTKSSDMEVHPPESPVSQGSPHVLESKADISNQENKQVGMELVTDEEEGQVLYCEETDGHDAVVEGAPIKGAETVEENDSSKFSQLTDKETVSMEMSSQDESDGSHSMNTATNKDVEGRRTDQSHHRSEGESQKQPRRQEKGSSKDRTSALETIKFKERVYPYPGYRSGTYRKSSRLGSSSEVHGSGRGFLDRSKHRQSTRFEVKREFGGREASNGFSSYRKPFDRFHEGTEKFLRVDNRRNYEVSLHNRLLSQSTSKDDNYGRELSTPQFFSRKAVGGMQAQPIHREVLYGDRAPTRGDVLAARGRKGLDGRMEVEPYNLETFSKKMAGRRVPNQMPKPWSSLNERRKSFSSDAECSIDNDWQARYDQIPYEKYKRYFLVDPDSVPIRAHPKAFPKPKVLHSDRFRGNEIPAGTSISFADPAAREKFSLDELYGEDAGLGGSIPEYKHDFGTSLRYNIDFGENINSSFHERHLDPELFEEHHSPSKHSSRVTYVLSDDGTQVPFEVINAPRVYDARDEVLPYYVKNAPGMYENNAMVTLVGEREEPAMFGKRKVTMLHDLKENPRAFHHGALDENIWSDKSNLSIDGGRVTQPRLLLRSGDRDMNLTMLKDLSSIREGEHEGGGYFDLAESRKTRQDFIERHVNQEPAQPPFIRYGALPPNRLCNFANIPGNRSKTDDDIRFVRRRGHLIPRPLDFDIHEGNMELSNIFRTESVSDDELDERLVADYRMGIRPLDLIHLKRKMQQNEKYNEERSGIKCGEKTFFGELFHGNDHLHNRRSSNDNFKFRRGSRNPSQI